MTRYIQGSLLVSFEDDTETDKKSGYYPAIFNVDAIQMAYKTFERPDASAATFVMTDVGAIGIDEDTYDRAVELLIDTPSESIKW